VSDPLLQTILIGENGLTDAALALTRLGRSGKTYTMQGLEEDAFSDSVDQSPHMGIVGRAISHIFATMEDLRSSGWEFSASLEMIEIYNETLNDLLAASAVRALLSVVAISTPSMPSSDTCCCVNRALQRLTFASTRTENRWR
jgi:hypothetical protein